MSRQTRIAKEQLLNRLARLQRRVQAADGKEIQQWAAEIADTEKAIATKSTGVDASKAAAGQNSRANANWPMSASRRAAAASRLVRLAKELLAEEDETETPAPVEENAGLEIASSLKKLAETLSADCEDCDDDDDADEDKD